MVRSGFLLLIVAVLAGCAPLALKPLPAGSLHEAFAVEGRFAVRYPTETGQDGGNGRIEWRHQREDDDLAIRDPIGGMIARVRRTGTVYALEVPDRPIEQSLDPDELTERVLGWRLPLQGMVWWLRGVPDPTLPLDAPVRLADDARVSSLRQRGWTVVVRARHTDTGLPERLELSRGTLQIRLFLPSWSEP